MDLQSLQKNLIRISQPLSSKVEEAFYKYPRHEFIPEYSLPEAYLDRPLTLWDKPPYASTISQPSFVLRILEYLKLEKGHKVFELGTGSGWNTALMAHLVGEQGQVVSVEVIPELALRAEKIVKKLKIKNIKIFAGDGFEGYEPDAPYDRAIFTAGSAEFPEKLFNQLKEGGRMVFVHEAHFGYDLLEVIEKINGEPVIQETVPCSFVSVVRKKESRLNNGTL
ncbi:protein-L-isoaspartate O-methyltransferase [Bdellovibrio bacteriovorus]